MITSIIDGRLRLRHPSLRAAGGQTVQREIAALGGVSEARLNPRVGSLLVSWDPHRIDREAVLATLRRLLPAGAAEPPPEAPGWLEGRSLRAVLTAALPDGPSLRGLRAALPAGLTRDGAVQTALLASVGVTALTGAFGWKAVHTAAGVALVALSGWHVLDTRARPAAKRRRARRRSGSGRERSS